MKRAKWIAWATMLAIVASGLVWGWWFLRSGQFEGLMRRVIVSEIARMTGGHVELARFRFDTNRLEATLDGLVIHGRELPPPTIIRAPKSASPPPAKPPAGPPPLFSAVQVRVRLKIISFFRRKVDLQEIVLRHPAVHILVDDEGRTNVPAPKRREPAAAAPLSERLFSLAVKQFRVEGAEFSYSRVNAPPAAPHRGIDGALEGLELSLDFNSGPFYAGRISWKRLTLEAGRYRPFIADAAGEFRIERDRVSFSRFDFNLPQSRLRTAWAMEKFAAPVFRFRYDGTVHLKELGEIFRKPRMPEGVVDFSGEGTFSRAAGQARLEVTGGFNAREIGMHFNFFHYAGISSAGRYEIHGDRLHLPEYTSQALGGTIHGTFSIESLFSHPRMRVEAHGRGLSLATVNHAVSNPRFPLDSLHWDGRVDVDSLVTWQGDFEHLETFGTGSIAPPQAPGQLIPTRSSFDYHYGPVAGGSVVRLKSTRIETPTSVILLDGTLGTRSSNLEISVDSNDLTHWNDLINTLRHAAEEGEAPIHVGGAARFRGRMLGTFARPIFAGHVVGTAASYEDAADGPHWFFDQVEGEVRYSPELLRFVAAGVSRGRSTAQGRVELTLDDWSFRPESPFMVLGSTRGGEVADFETFFERKLPVKGTLTAQVDMMGTRARPVLSARVSITRGSLYGEPLDSMRASIRQQGEEYWFDEIELADGPGRATGRLHYNAPSGESEFQITGTNIQLNRLEWLQTARLPLGGVAQFQATGKGPIRAPALDGSLRLTGVTIGGDRLGGLEARFATANRVTRIEVFAALREGNLTGEGEVRLEGDYPVSAHLNFTEFDLDPFIITAFRLPGLTGHSSSDGSFAISGSLAQPASLEIVADLSRLEFAYQEIALRNQGPLRFAYRREEVRIERAHLTGAGTDLTLVGYARLPAEAKAAAAGARMNLTLNGSLNLGLLRNLVPDLATSGNAEVQATVFGAFRSPQINGRVKISGAAVSYGDLPTGLSDIRGELVFNASHLEIERMETQAGGGTLQISGGVTYANGISFDLRSQARQVRIRYPEGMSWLVDGRLRLVGTPGGGLLTGDVVVFRSTITREFDFGAMLARVKQPANIPVTANPFLRNLQFQIQATSAPDVRLEWGSARFPSEASLRVRGTWEHPVILGHIHLLGGEISFRGNKYQVTRGDINFSNPFRVDPVLNIEAQSRVQQYDVTVNFSGSLAHLSLSYRSDPPLPSSDIIALLALGRTGEESQLRQAQQVQVPEIGATSLLSEAISSQVGGRIERLFGVSRFRVDPFLAGTEQNPSARVTFEQRVTRDLTITYVSNVTSTQQQIIQIEYAVNRDVSIIALRDQNGTFGLDVKFKKRFK